MYLIDKPKYQYIFWLQKKLYYIFFSFIFLPYVKVINIPTDTQPYALLLAMCLFFVFKIKFNKYNLVLFFLLIYATLIFLIDTKSLNSIRSLLNYFTLFFVSYATYKIFKTEKINAEKFFSVIFFIWFIVSFMQVIYDPHFLTFLISNPRTTPDRGITGLAPEPTHLGMMFIFFILFALSLDGFKYKNIVIGISALSILFFAKSAMAALFLSFMFVLYVITHVRLKFIMYFIFGVGVFINIVSILDGTRLQHVLSLLWDDPTQLLMLDASVNDRFFHIFFSLKGLYDNYLLPNGFNAWLPYVSTQLIEYKDFVIIEWFSLSGRVMSGYGAALFELGIFFLAVPLLITFSLIKIYPTKINKVVFFSLFINSIMFSAIPIAYPPFAFYLGYLNYKASVSK